MRTSAQTGSFKMSDAQACAIGTSYSGIEKGDRMRGFVAMLITLAGAAPSVTITQQCSWDGVTFYDPYDSTGTAIGKVCAALTGTAYIQASPVLSPYFRYKIVATADSIVTLQVVSQE